MKWIIFASVVFIAISLAPAYAQLPPPGPMLTGTCASIGHSTSCCPQSSNRDDCRASDGNCYCAHDCHLSHNSDCCMDVACRSSKYAIDNNFLLCLHAMSTIMANINSYYYSADPTMCAHVGIYGCCNITSPGDCEVRNGQDLCFCDTSCHTRGDCCPDACAREFNLIYCESMRFMLHHNNV